MKHNKIVDYFLKIACVTKIKSNDECFNDAISYHLGMLKVDSFKHFIVDYLIESTSVVEPFIILEMMYDYRKKYPLIINLSL